ncbi:hypothetical protein BT69DRAFT_1327276 [Atractiella rhizophila]|nr:hypothetical protein BT69DRAFT_1327276 [Atractiella rhizophila]
MPLIPSLPVEKRVPLLCLLPFIRDLSFQVVFKIQSSSSLPGGIGDDIAAMRMQSRYHGIRWLKTKGCWRRVGSLKLNAAYKALSLREHKSLCWVPSEDSSSVKKEFEQAGICTTYFSKAELQNIEMPWVNLHPLYSSRLTKSKRWIARKAVVTLDNGTIHDPNLHPHYEASDAPLYPWTSSTFPRPKGSRYDKQLQIWAEAKADAQRAAVPAEGNQYGFREDVEPIYGPERPRSNLHPRRIIQRNIRAFPGLGRWG